MHAHSFLLQHFVASSLLGLSLSHMYRNLTKDHTSPCHHFQILQALNHTGSTSLQTTSRDSLMWSNRYNRDDPEDFYHGELAGDIFICRTESNKLDPRGVLMVLYSFPGSGVVFIFILNILKDECLVSQAFGCSELSYIVVS